MTMTIQNAIDKIIASVPGAPFSDTVDTVKVGDASQEITGITVAFLATSEVIKKAFQLGTNLIITHEPIFYNHLDATDWLAEHSSYQAKRQLIEKSGVVIWRFHDYLHSLPPDGTVMGLHKELNWESYALPDQPFMCKIPPMTLLAIAEWVKDRLGLTSVRVVGDLEATCRTIGILPGFPPAEMQIGVLGRSDVDVLITGEIHEWETSEYVRDAAYLGYKKGLIVTGHLASEEPGMKWIIPWMQERLPGIEISFVPTGNAFHQV
jgi:putative NIF3 family GTP cyclohydrolase 1 type 2